MPWNASAKDARDRYLEFTDAWMRLFRAWATGTTTNPAYATDINVTFALAGNRFRQAVPANAPFTEEARIRRIFDRVY
jgi:hypothetical protein